MTKCRSGKSILYTQEAGCPAGYVIVGGELGGNLSVIGKSPEIVAQENTARQLQIERERRQQSAAATDDHIVAWNAPVQDDKRFLCQSLATEATTLEAAMRQNSTDRLRERHREVRDLQFRNRC